MVEKYKTFEEIPDVSGLALHQWTSSVIFVENASRDQCLKFGDMLASAWNSNKMIARTEYLDLHSATDDGFFCSVKCKRLHDIGPST